MKKAALAFVWLAVSGVVSVQADLTTNLPAVADTSLFETDPDNNLGALSDVPAGTTAGSAGRPFRCRGLFRFDLTSIPSNATVTAVSLTLQVVKRPSTGPGTVFGLSRMLQNWVEGTGAGISSGAPAEPGETTWNNRFAPATAWSSPGGRAEIDYVATFSATNSVDDLGFYTFSAPGLVADIRAWLRDPQTNFGWMLATIDETVPASARRFASRENPSGAPSLTIQYRLLNPPAPLSISAVNLSDKQIHFVFIAEANRTYSVEFRPLGDVLGSWSVLTNIPARLLPATIDVADSVNSTNRCYRVRTP